MKKATFILVLLLQTFSTIRAQTPTVFDWETAIDHGDNITQTVNGIELTFTGESDAHLLNGNGIGGSSGNLAVSSEANTATSVSFSFNQTVDVNSILPLEGYGVTVDFTFTPMGGSNSPVVVSLVSGEAPTVPVDLNWVGVTSFTVTASVPVQFAFDNVSVVSLGSSSTIFEWETGVKHPDGFNTSVTETIDGITVTVVDNDPNNGNSPSLNDPFGEDFLGTSGLVVSTGSSVGVTISFNEPVDVHSILLVDSRARDDGRELTFTPYGGGANSPVVVTLVGGVIPGGGTLNLNWTNVTSFTVAVTASPLTLTINYFIDDLSVSAIESLSVTEDMFHRTKAYPNPVKNMLYIKNVSDIKSINIYNNLGQRVLQSKQTSIDMSHLSKGMYFMQINTAQGTKTKRIIKK